MRTPDSNGDRVLKEYLSGKSSLSNAYRQHANDEPSAAVDDAVRASARRELNAGRRHIINPFGRQWAVPASLAAMLLLSIGLVMFMSNETVTTPFNSDFLEEKVMERDIMLPATRLDRFADDKGAAPAAPSAGQRAEKKTKTDKSTTTKSLSDMGKRMQPVSTGKIKQKFRSRRAAEDIRKQPRQQNKPAAVMPNAVKPMLQMEMEVPAESATSTVLPPEEWLRRIRGLRAQGRIVEADASLTDFRKAYPDYPLDSLRN
ncbi:MAG: hypothetical protein V3R65_00145 [Acidiferrobacterales bacterium]